MLFVVAAAGSGRGRDEPTEEAGQGRGASAAGSRNSHCASDWPACGGGPQAATGRGPACMRAWPPVYPATHGRRRTDETAVRARHADEKCKGRRWRRAELG